MRSTRKREKLVAAPRERLWGLIEATPWLIWQLLTKRPENISPVVPWGSE
jgi:protein gp37